MPHYWERKTVTIKHCPYFLLTVLLTWNIGHLLHDTSDAKIVLLQYVSPPANCGTFSTQPSDWNGNAMSSAILTWHPKIAQLQKIDWKQMGCKTNIAKQGNQASWCPCSSLMKLEPSNNQVPVFANRWRRNRRKFGIPRGCSTPRRSSLSWECVWS